MGTYVLTQVLIKLIYIDSVSLYSQGPEYTTSSKLNQSVFLSLSIKTTLYYSVIITSNHQHVQPHYDDFLVYIGIYLPTAIILTFLGATWTKIILRIQHHLRRFSCITETHSGIPAVSCDRWAINIVFTVFNLKKSISSVLWASQFINIQTYTGRYPTGCHT